MTTRNRIRSSAVLVVAAMVILGPIALTSRAATMSASPTAPPVDGEDIANAGAVTLKEKWFAGDAFGEPSSAKGQTFTAGIVDVRLKAITYQVAANQKAEPVKTYVIRVGKVSGTTFTGIHTETATQDFTWGGGEHMTWTFDSPVLLSANTTYAIDIGMTGSTSARQTGIPYLNCTGDTYAGGARYSSGKGGVGVAKMRLHAGHDRIFHLDLESTAGPSPKGGNHPPKNPPASDSQPPTVATNTSEKPAAPAAPKAPAKPAVPAAPAAPVDPKGPAKPAFPATFDTTSTTAKPSLKVLGVSEARRKIDEDDLEFRFLRNVKVGRAIEAAVLDVDTTSGHMHLYLRGGKNYVVAIAHYHDDDKAYLMEWLSMKAFHQKRQEAKGGPVPAKALPAAPPAIADALALRLRTDTDRGEVEAGDSQNTYSTDHEVTVQVVTSAGAPADIPKGELQLVAYVTHALKDARMHGAVAIAAYDTDSSAVKELKIPSENIDAFAAGRTENKVFRFITKTVKGKGARKVGKRNLSYRWEHAQTLVGVRARLLVGGKLAAEAVYPSDLERRLEEHR